MHYTIINKLFSFLFPGSSPSSSVSPRQESPLNHIPFVAPRHLDETPLNLSTAAPRPLTSASALAPPTSGAAFPAFPSALGALHSGLLPAGVRPLLFPPHPMNPAAAYSSVYPSSQAQANGQLTGNPLAMGSSAAAAALLGQLHNMNDLGHIERVSVMGVK